MRLFLLFLSLLGLFLPHVSAQTEDCWLAYHSDETGDWEIHALGRDWQRNLSQGIGKNIFDLYPARSPIADEIVFASTRDGNWELYRVSLAGETPQRLTFTDSIELDPVFSPDGQSIIYDSNPEQNWDIYRLDLATGETKRLTEHPANDLNASPWGNFITFQTDRDGLWQIYRLDLTTGELIRLSDGLGNDFEAFYSPDGGLLVFRSVRDDPLGVKSTLHLLDGDEMRLISELGNHALNAAWSPDGKYLAYQMDTGGNGEFDIYLYELGRGESRQLTSGGISSAPTWYCGGLVLTATIGGESDLFWLENVSLDIPTQAIRLTNERGNQQDAVSFPHEENASRREALPPPH